MMVDIQAAGRALAEARRERRNLDELPGGLPEDEASAYAIQRAAISAYGEKRVGYKVGATSPEARAILKTDHPFQAPLFAADCHESGVTFAMPGYGLIGLEPEFALRLGEDLPARDEAYGIDEVRQAVVTVHPAFEIIGLRLPTELFKNAIIVTTDFGANVGFTAGEGVQDWQAQDLSAIQVRASVDGEEVATGSGANVMGNPLNSLLWLVNDLASRGEGLSAGDWISTGTCAGVVAIAPGQRAEADFGPFGRISLSLTA
ncbi:MAG: fumarylacetoacetate hydrolase family protein [Pseudomonadota bacterium]